MKDFFAAIRSSNLAEVQRLIGSDRSIVRAVAPKTPKRDRGQSPLQVAFKTGNFDIADVIIDSGADPNFIEAEDASDWRAPVIHDAIRAAVFSSRFLGTSGPMNTKAQFERALSSLAKLIDAGANVRGVDSYGNNCLMRAALDARQLLLDADSSDDVQRVFSMLIGRGADIHESTAQRPSVAEAEANSQIAQFLR